MIDISEARTLLERILNAPPNSLTNVTAIEDLPNWDSLTLLSLIAIVDEEYGKTLKGSDVQAASSLDDLVHLINS